MSTIVRLTSSEALEAFRGWVELAIPALTEVNLAKQNIADFARPALPYATVERIRARDLAGVYRRAGDEVAPADPDGATNVLELTVQRELTVEVAFYGDAGPDYCELLATTQGRLDSQAYLSTAGIAVRPLSDDQDFRELRDTVHEASALQEFGVVYVLEDLSRVGTIEEVEVMGYPPMPTT